MTLSGITSPALSGIEAQAALIEAQIITQADKEQAVQDTLDEDRAAWNSARLSLRLVDELEGELSPVAVRMAVGWQYYKTEATIKRREFVARIIPAGLVAEHPRLRFSHWKVIADAKHLEDREQARADFIGWVYDYLEQWGKLPSVRTLEGWVYQGDNERAAAVWRSRSDSILDQLDKVYHDKYCPPSMRYLVGWVRGILDNYLKTGVSVLDESKTPAG